MRAMVWTLLCCSLALLLGACASTPGGKTVADKGCCTSPAQFSYQALAPDGALALDISAQSPVFSFDQGRGPFAAVRLPAGKAGLRVQLPPLGRGPSSVLCPSLTFLSAQYQPLRTVFERPHWFALTPMTGSYFYADYAVPAGAAFVVLHAEPAHAAQRYAMPASAYDPALPASPLLYMGAPGETQYAACASTGQVALIARTAAPAP